jgi:hypothetical protein
VVVHEKVTFADGDWATAAQTGLRVKARDDQNVDESRPSVRLQNAVVPLPRAGVDQGWRPADRTATSHAPARAEWRWKRRRSHLPGASPHHVQQHPDPSLAWRRWTCCFRADAMLVGGRYHENKEAEGGMVAPARRCMEEVAHVVEKKAVASTGRNREVQVREMIVQEDLR